MKKHILIIICLFLFAVTAKSQTVNYAEYFIDVDSGLGNGTPISFTADSIISLDSIVINTSTLSLGYHWIYVRVKDSDEKWSMYTSKRFFVYDDSPIQAINDTVVLTEAAYIIADSIPYSWQGTTVNFTPDDTVAYLDSIQGLVLPIGQHTISLRVRDSKGFWSYPMTSIFNVCPSAEPFASYDYYVSGYDLILDNTSTSQDSCIWDFDDGNSSTQVDLVHHYDSAGYYNVQLTSMNNCTTNTITKTVLVQGINSISPNNGGNIGVVIMSITGAGFNDSTIVKLRDASGVNYIFSMDSSTLVANGTEIQTTFDLRGAAIGVWDIIVEVPNDTTFVLSGSFSIVLGVFPKINIGLNGPQKVRVNRWTNFEFNLNNTGNVDAIGVPFWFAVSQNCEINIQELITHHPADSIVNWDTVPQFALVDTLINIISPLKLYGYYIPVVRAGENYKFNFSIKFTSPTIDIYYWANRPTMLYDSSQINSLVSSTTDCFVDPKKIDCLGAIAGSFNPNPVVNCIISFITADLQIFNAATCKSNYSKSYVDNVMSNLEIFGAAGRSCFTSLVLFSDRLKRSYKLLTNILNAASGAGSVTDAFGCGDAFGSDLANLFTPNTIASYDPNEKIGNVGALSCQIINTQSSLKYIVHFENVDTATAPAQTVILTDTLDNSNLNLNSLQFESFGFSDTMVSIPSGRKSYSTDIDLRPSIPLIARFSAYLNDSTNVLTVKIESIDTLTMEPTTNPLIGFLLPNNSTGRGEGFVTFSVKAKDSIATGTIINNKADIYFDENPPITTPTWTNIIDNLKPQSQVNSLLPATQGDSLLVNWTSSDNGPAGVYTHNIYYNVNNGDWFLWKYNTSLTSEYFHGDIDSTYGFYSIAIDSALNVEDAPLAPDAITTLTVGIAEYNQTQMIVKLFPNPAKTSVSIFIKRFDKNKNDFNIIARDITGRTVRSEKLNITSETKTIQLDISQFVCGIYFFEITDGTHRTFKKLIKN